MPRRVPTPKPFGPYSLASLVLVLGSAFKQTRARAKAGHTAVWWPCGCRAEGPHDAGLLVEPCEADRPAFRQPRG
jgi:hypothetical protein